MSLNPLDEMHNMISVAFLKALCRPENRSLEWKSCCITVRKVKGLLVQKCLVNNHSLLLWAVCRVNENYPVPIGMENRLMNANGWLETLLNS